MYRVAALTHIVAAQVKSMSTTTQEPMAAPEFPAFLGRHFVCLAFFDEPNDIKNVKHAVGASYFTVTATVFSVQGHWFFLTAKHCFDEIDERLQKGDRRISRCEIYDSFGDLAEHQHPVPFDYSSSIKIKIGEDGDFDVGAIFISKATRELLTKNGIVPLSERAWRDTVPEQCDYYAVVGIPTNTLDDASALISKSASRFDIELLFVGVDRLADRPEGIDERQTERFYGKLRLPDESQGSRKSVNLFGMSGGPIFGFKRDTAGNFKYWIIAMQSTWLPSQNIITGCHAKLAGYSIEWPLLEALKHSNQVRGTDETNASSD